MRTTFFILVALIGFSSTILFTDLSGSLEVRATTAHALVALPTPIIVEQSAPLSAPLLVEAPRPPEEIQQKVAAVSAPLPQNVPRGDAGLPVRVMIPSIGLDSPIQNVGVNAKGEMDVPAGDTNNVGWYKSGTVPGKSGSAVLAAHVFAAFDQLDELAVGSEIFVETKDGTRLRFVVEDATTYALQDLSANFLFNRNDAKRLNLITCAGTFIQSKDTYDRRLVVYAKLV